MNKNIKQLVPELRFPEFRDAGKWEIEDLGSKTVKVGSGITPKGGDSNYKRNGRPFVRSQNIGWGCLILDDVAYIDDDTHATFTSTEILEKDVLLNITGASIGRSAIADQRIKGGNVNQHVCIIRTQENKLNPFFLNQYLLSDYGQDQIDSFQAGGNRQGLNFQQIRSFSIPLPPKEKEQQKIADCLSSIDDLITVQTQKVEALKIHKKGLMQQLFPREGETVPRLRFPEFRDAGEWECKQLKDACGKPFSGGTPSTTNRTYYGGTIPFIRSGEIDKHFTELFLTEKGLSNSSAKLVQVGDVLVALYGANSGEVALSKMHGAINQAVLCLRSKTDNTFLYQYLLLKKDEITTKYLQGGQGNLSGDIVKSIELQFPQKSEQKTIADCLSSIDDLISNQSQKLEALKIHKKGLMQQLFPSTEADRE